MSIINITSENFNSEVLQREDAILLDFWATWCGPCRMIAPVLEEIAKENPSVTIGKVDVDNESQIAANFGIMSIPTLVVMKDGKPMATKIGLCGKEEILKLLEV